MDPKQPRTIPIQGVKVQFPFKPYPSQLSMMAKIIKGISSSKNCLLESPTGTGKSLALLCSALAWQSEYVEKAQNSIGKTRDACCCKCHVKKCSSSPTDPKTTAASASSKYFPPNSSQGAGVDASCATSPDLKSSADLCSHEEDNDFKTPKMKIKTPVGNISKKRVHTPISYEDANKILTPQQWKMEVTSTRANLPQEDDACTKSDCCADYKEACTKCDCAQETSEKPNIRPPTIFYCTRTHRQIKQITRELGRTAYRSTPMTILASRDNTCINKQVLQMSNRNDGCREKVDLRGCSYYDKSKKITNNVIVTSGLDTAWDIEDFKEVCASLGCCPYFSARELKTNAHLIFCPYNYLIDPVIRESMEIAIENQVVILDEAHNVEDFARDAASASFTEEQLSKASLDLGVMIHENVKPGNHSNLKNMVERVLRVVNENGQYLPKKSFDEFSKCWSGPELVVMLDRMGLTTDRVEELRGDLAAITEEKDQDEIRRKNAKGRIVKLPSSALMTLKNLFEVLRFINKDKMKYLDDYRLVIIKKKEFRSGPTNNEWLNKKNRGRNNPQPEMSLTLHLWCLNPAVAFSDFESVRCIVLTSGTLSPLTSFESELGMSFPIQLEANHVIKAEQVLVGTIGKGPKGGQLLASYKKSETFDFQDETGGTILQICKAIPHGVLCFVSSYTMLEKLRKRWQMTGLWSDIQDVKSIYCEPRKSDAEDFDEVIKNFYTAIRLSESDGSHNGALLIAVCRGKVSEGIDFSDNNARAVITIGIPFPSIKDAQVELKRQYNDRHSHRKGLLTGSEWYEIQAYRALNQALGRCIRHRRDWGAIILVDERFSTQSNKYIKGISKWLRSKVTHFQNFSDIRQALTSFAQEMKSAEDLDETYVSSSPVTDASVNISPNNPNTPDTSLRRNNFASPQLPAAKPKENYSLFTPTTTKLKGRTPVSLATASAKDLRAKFSAPQACSTPAAKATRNTTVSKTIVQQIAPKAFDSLPAELMKALTPEIITTWNRFLVTVGGQPVFVKQKNDQGQDSYSPAISNDGKLFFITLPPAQSHQMPTATVVDNPSSDVALTTDVDAVILTVPGAETNHSPVAVKSEDNRAEKQKLGTKKRQKGVVYESPEQEKTLSVGLKIEDVRAEDVNGNICAKLGVGVMGLKCMEKEDSSADIDVKKDTALDSYTPYLYSGASSSIKVDLGSETGLTGRKKLFKFVNLPESASTGLDKTCSVDSKICVVSDSAAVTIIKAETPVTVTDLERCTSPLLFDSESNDACDPHVDNNDINPEFSSTIQKPKEELSTTVQEAKDSSSVSVTGNRHNIRMSRLAKFKYTKNSDDALGNEKEDTDDKEPQIVTRRGRKRRGSSANKQKAKKQNVDLLDQVDNTNQDCELTCQQCRQAVVSTFQCGVETFRKETSPSFILKIGMKSAQSYAFDKTQSSLLFKRLETHTNESELYNCYWSAEDACSVQYLVCKHCSKEMFLPIGAQVLAVADGPCRFNVGQIWLSSEAFR